MANDHSARTVSLLIVYGGVPQKLPTGFFGEIFPSGSPILAALDSVQPSSRAITAPTIFGRWVPRAFF